MKIAFVFPGQGSQYAGMGRDLAEKYPAAREVFREADRSLGIGISRLAFEGPAEDLKLTENTQPAILAASVAAFRILEERGIRPDFAAGHSLGEYSALVAAGAIRFTDAVVLVRRRGEYMQQAVPAGAGAMGAVLGLDLAAVETICKRAAAESRSAAMSAGGGSTVGTNYIATPANLNSPGQIVVAGNLQAVERALVLAKEVGASRAVLLPVSAPFHCDLMKPAEERLAPELDRLEIIEPRIPVIANVDAAPVRNAGEVRLALKRQVSRPVRWQECVERLLSEGVRTFVEVGPGKVLLGLIRSIDRSVKVLNAEDEKSVENVLSALL